MSGLQKVGARFKSGNARPARKECPMPDAFSGAQPMRVAALSARQPTPFEMSPDRAAREALAVLLGVTSIQHLRFAGTVAADGTRDFILTGQLSAKVVQPCVVTLDPVTTDVAETVIRRYLADWTEPDDDEAEVPQDDTREPLGPVIDPAAVMAEALALALPDYPRAPGVLLGEVAVAPPGVAPLRDADVKPFAGLAALQRKLAGTDGDDPAG
jgi:uncharacterized metal-binding protein YceD (DUF177 family)